MRLRYSVPISGKKRFASSLPSASRPTSPFWPSGTSATERTFSRRASVWRSASGIARPPCGCGTWIFSRSSGCWSKNWGWPRRKRAMSSAFILLLDLEGAFERRFGGALHPYRIVAARPSDGQRAAARRDEHRRLGELLHDGHDRRRARSGAAGERLAGAALPHAQRYAVLPEDVQVAGVHAF